MFFFCFVFFPPQVIFFDVLDYFNIVILIFLQSIVKLDLFIRLAFNIFKILFFPPLHILGLDTYVPKKNVYHYELNSNLFYEIH